MLPHHRHIRICMRYVRICIYVYHNTGIPNDLLMHMLSVLCLCIWVFRCNPGAMVRAVRSRSVPEDQFVPQFARFPGALKRAAPSRNSQHNLVKAFGSLGLCSLHGTSPSPSCPLGIRLRPSCTTPPPRLVPQDHHKVEGAHVTTVSIVC